MKNFTITESQKPDDVVTENDQAEEITENHVNFSNMPQVKVKTAVNFFNENQG